MLKRTVARLLLFGIPFGLSYWVTRPTPRIAPVETRTLVVCAYPGDRPGELRIHLDPGGCPDAVRSANDAAPVSVFPAVSNPESPLDQTADKPLSIPF